MPESVTTNDREVAMIFAAVELTKGTTYESAEDTTRPADTPDGAVKAFTTIYRAIVEATEKP